MPCLEWSAEEMEWEQGSGPKRRMCCRTQGWISLHPEKAYFRPLGQLSMIFNESFTFFSISCQFSMLFNENFIFFSFFYQFSMLSNWNFAFFFIFLLIFNVIQWEICIFLFFVNFPCYSMGSLHFVIFPCYSMEFENWEGSGGGMYVHTDVRTDKRTDVWKDRQTWSLK